MKGVSYTFVRRQSRKAMLRWLSMPQQFEAEWRKDSINGSEEHVNAVVTKAAGPVLSLTSDKSGGASGTAFGLNDLVLFTGSL